MDFELSAEDAAFRDEIRTWLEERRELIEKTRAQTAEYGGEKALELHRVWEKELYNGGWAGVAWPKEHGGRDASLFQQALFTEEYVRARAPERINRLGLGLIGPTLMVYGTEEQKKEHLAKILSCDEIWCQGFSEPGAGSDLASLRTRAVLDGDDYVINGQKVWTSQASYADWIFVLVRTDTEAPKHKGITFIIADMKTPGIEVRPMKQINGKSGFAETFFTDVRVPAANVIDKPNNGWKVAMTTLGFERGTGLGSPMVFNRQWKELVELTKETQRYDHKASEDPDIRKRIAQGFIETRVFELTNKRVLSQLSKGKQLGPEASLSKLFWSEMEARLEELQIDTLGPRGELATGSPDGGEWFSEYLYARASMIYAGTSEIQKNIIAQRVLGLPKE
ncbi:MAG TPA: acyl-CoA dehydrogenase [Candidatus Solibacter sp.]|jgi:alkylation response protein AidB-like acyl-CoA dehydrogenase|nr:acyl-CoA dehydrogenase [Candidatus Solibacter sp.]